MKLFHRTASARRVARSRAGTAAVELAVCTPLIVSLVFGAMETASVIFLKQALSVAAYEAAQRATARGGTTADAKQAAEAVLVAHGVTGGTIDITPSVSTQTETGTEIVATATAPMSGNTFIFQFFSGDEDLIASMTMVRL